jgi:type II secretory pathway component PulF
MKSMEIIIGGVSSRELLLLIRQLYASIHAGYDVSEALDIASFQAHGRLRQILDDVQKSVAKGSYLSEALEKHKKYFSPLFLSLIKTGEFSGTLEDNLKRLLVIVEKEQQFRQKLRSAMIYPTFVLVAVTFLGLSISIFVLPTLLPLFKSLNVELPVSTQILMWFAQLFKDHGVLIFFSFIGIVAYLYWLSRQKMVKPYTHWLALYFPFFGPLNKKLILARFGDSLGSLMRSGVPIDASLQIMMDVIENHYYRNAIRSMIHSLEKGRTLSYVLEQNPALFDGIFVKLISLGEVTGSLADACDNVSNYFNDEVDETMKNISVTLEPALLLVVGGLVLFVALSILGPIYKITGSLR